MAVSEDPIKAYAKHFDFVGVTYRQTSARSLVTGLRIPMPYYDYGCQFEVRMDGSWLIIRAFPHLCVTPESAPAVSRFLMSANAQLFEARCALVQCCVVMQTEFPIARSNRNLFLERVTGLVLQIKRVAIEIATLVNDADVRELFMEAMRLADQRILPEGFEQEEPDFGISLNVMPAGLPLKGK